MKIIKIPSLLLLFLLLSISAFAADLPKLIDVGADKDDLYQQTK